MKKILRHIIVLAVTLSIMPLASSFNFILDSIIIGLGCKSRNSQRKDI